MDVTTKINKINKRKWEEYNIRTDFTSLRILTFIKVMIITTVVLATYWFMTNIITSVYISKISVLLLIVLIFYYLVETLVFLHKSSLTILFIPGNIQIIEGNYFDSIQGKIIINRGLIFKRIRTLGISEFDRVTVFQNPIQRILNTGTIKLIEVNKLSDTTSIYFSYIKNPQNIARKIQSMIDIEGSVTQRIKSFSNAEVISQ
ncbi:MAG: hypothetical protein Q9M91_08840 [Candidatus Dojkabacteria bacterium]|nr:hypothetical protein [Candidatus Dojkabacteria bacterium]MDQ7021879.1 hypothetical protein [Candidatus Dojkabacteria bacterium]